MKVFWEIKHKHAIVKTMIYEYYGSILLGKTCFSFQEAVKLDLCQFTPPLPSSLSSSGILTPALRVSEVPPLFPSLAKSFFFPSYFDARLSVPHGEG